MDVLKKIITDAYQNIHARQHQREKEQKTLAFEQGYNTYDYSTELMVLLVGYSMR